MPKLTDREVYAIREGWIDALDWMMEVLDDEINYQEQRYGMESGCNPESPAPVPVVIFSILERILTIVTHRRKEWMLSD